MDDWQYVVREVVTDPKGRQWTVALMDALGQEDDPDIPNKLSEPQYSSGRYFALIYSASGGLQWERGYSSPSEATCAFDDLRIAVIDGSLDPSQPVFRQDLGDCHSATRSASPLSWLLRWIFLAFSLPARI